MKKLNLQIEVPEQDDLPEFDRAEWRPPNVGEYFITTDQTVEMVSDNLIHSRLVLIPRGKWVDATRSHLAQQIQGSRTFRWRVRASESHPWKEVEDIIGFSRGNFVRENWQAFNQAQVFDDGPVIPSPTKPIKRV